MWHWTRRILIGACMALSVAAVTGATYQWIATHRELATTPPPGQLVDVGGHRLHIWCVGSGTPTVVLETGLGGMSADWGFVQPEAARFTRVCSYDRAGLGYSDSGPSPRTARRIARELAHLLNRSRISGPRFSLARLSEGSRYVFSPLTMPSASQGSCSSMRRTRTNWTTCLGWPHSSPFCLLPGCSDYWACRSARDPTRWRPRFGDSRGRHSSVRQRTTRQQTKSYTFGKVRRRSRRVAVSSRSLWWSSRLGEALISVWRTLQQDQVQLSVRGCQVIAAESGHVVPIDQPSVVVDGIRAIVDAVRKGGDAGFCR